tara:strand:+ start:104 stop:619 length:516 start_codon:yes stop_codon:yes gene_type:complete
MLGCPNAGSDLALAHPIVEFVFQVLPKLETTGFQDAFLDGNGQAACDLMPGSPFLRKLNESIIHSRRYYLFAGTGGYLTPLEWQDLRLGILSIANSNTKIGDTLRPQITYFANNCSDELLKNRGDGVVSVESVFSIPARLKLKIHRDHTGLIRVSGHDDKLLMKIIDCIKE